MSRQVSATDDGVIAVGDQTIVVSDDTVFAHEGGEHAIPEGQRVDVSGFSLDHGTIHATRIDDHGTDAESEDFEANGFVPLAPSRVGLERDAGVGGDLAQPAVVGPQRRALQRRRRETVRGDPTDFTAEHPATGASHR